MTKETAAWESPRCSARDFRLTPEPGAFRASGAPFDFGRGIGWSGLVVSHKRPRENKDQGRVSAEPPEGLLCSLVYRTKSVYYALSIEEDRTLENLPWFRNARIPKE
jgi:hypothetical protein